MSCLFVAISCAWLASCFLLALGPRLAFFFVALVLGSRLAAFVFGSRASPELFFLVLLCLAVSRPDFLFYSRAWPMC